MRKLLVLLLLFGCGDTGSSKVEVNTSQASEQNQNTDGDEDGACDRNCTLECRAGGGFYYQLVCGTTEAPTDILDSGEALTVGSLPVECLLRDLPPCDADEPLEE